MKTYLGKVKTFILAKKKMIIPAVIIVLVIVFFVFRNKKPDLANVETVKYADLTRSVRATGQVISNTDLDLSFSKDGVVKSVRVKVGDKVSTGAILATLDQGQVLSTLTQARGALLGAEAKYEKTLEGASSEELALAEVALKNALSDLANKKSSQRVLVANAYQKLLNSSIAASSVSGSPGTPTISGTYTLGKEGEIKISTYQSGSGSRFNVSGLFDASGVASSTTPEPIGNSGLYILFPDASSSGDWIISIPNKKAADYLANYNAYKDALEDETSIVAQAESLVDQKQAELNLKKAAARGSDIDIARAEVLSAQGSLQSAQASYEDTIIRAPALGTITKISIKYGELARSGTPVITLQDVTSFYVEALINEANISYLQIGQDVAVTFDAFGSDKKFSGRVAQIEPSSDVNDGVVNYKIKVEINDSNQLGYTIRPGMNANIDVRAGYVTHVLAIPNIALTKKDGRNFVNVFTDEKNKKSEEREVRAGFLGDNNLVEIVSGLTEGDRVALLTQ